MSTLLADLRYAVRGLRRSPLFSIVAVLSLALGIGANTAIFTLIDQVLLRKLPVTRPEELVMLYQQGAHMGSNMGTRMHSYPHLPGLPEARRAPGRGALPPADSRLREHRQPAPSASQAELVSGNYFSMLGVKPALGRVFNSQEDDQVYQGHPVVGAELRLLGQPLRERPERDREEDPRQRLADDDRRRLGGGVCRHRSGAIAADSRADPDEDRHDAGMDVAADGRSPGPLGAGLRPAQAWLHG